MFNAKIICVYREELAIIENRILEKELLAKKKAEKRAKNIAVSKLKKKFFQHRKMCESDGF